VLFLSNGLEPFAWVWWQAINPSFQWTLISTGWPQKPTFSYELSKKYWVIKQYTQVVPPGVPSYASPQAGGASVSQRFLRPRSRAAVDICRELQDHTCHTDPCHPRVQSRGIRNGGPWLGCAELQQVRTCTVSTEARRGFLTRGTSTARPKASPGSPLATSQGHEEKDGTPSPCSLMAELQGLYYGGDQPTLTRLAHF